MKKIIRLTESDIHRMVMEAMNELSGELLGHAFGVADSTGRNIQARKFLNASEEAWNRDYGWENEPDREGILTSCDFHHLSFTDTQLDPTQPTVEEVTGSDSANRMATNRLKPAQRVKYFKGVEAKRRMQQGIDPNGNPYK